MEYDPNNSNLVNKPGRPGEWDKICLKCNTELTPENHHQGFFFCESCWQENLPERHKRIALDLALRKSERIRKGVNQ